MKYLIVEHSFDPPLKEDDVYNISERLGPCLEQHNIKAMRSYVSEDGSRMICAFEAPDAESVRIAHRTADVKFDKVWVGEAFIKNLEEVTE